MLHFLFSQAKRFRASSEARLTFMTPDAPPNMDDVQRVFEEKRDAMAAPDKTRMNEYVKEKAKAMLNEAKDKTDETEKFARAINALVADPNFAVPADKSYLIQLGKKLNFITNDDEIAMMKREKMEEDQKEITNRFGIKLKDAKVRAILNEANANRSDANKMMDLKLVLEEGLPPELLESYRLMEQKWGTALDVLNALKLLDPAPVAPLVPDGSTRVRMVRGEACPDSDVNRMAIEFSQLWMQFAAVTNQYFPPMGNGRRAWTTARANAFNADPYVQNLKNRIGCTEAKFVRWGVLSRPVFCSSMQAGPYAMYATAMRYSQMFARGVPGGVTNFEATRTRRAIVEHRGTREVGTRLPDGRLVLRDGRYVPAERDGAEPSARSGTRTRPTKSPRGTPRPKPEDSPTGRPAKTAEKPPTVDPEKAKKKAELEAKLVPLREREKVARERVRSAPDAEKDAALEQLQKITDEIAGVAADIQALEGQVSDPSTRPPKKETPKPAEKVKKKFNEAVTLDELKAQSIEEEDAKKILIVVDLAREWLAKHPRNPNPMMDAYHLNIENALSELLTAAFDSSIAREKVVKNRVDSVKYHLERALARDCGTVRDIPNNIFDQGPVKTVALNEPFNIALGPELNIRLYDENGEHLLTHSYLIRTSTHLYTKERFETFIAAMDLVEKKFPDKVGPGINSAFEVKLKKPVTLIIDSNGAPNSIRRIQVAGAPPVPEKPFESENRKLAEAAAKLTLPFVPEPGVQKRLSTDFRVLTLIHKGQYTYVDIQKAIESPAAFLEVQEQVTKSASKLVLDVQEEEETKKKMPK